MRRILVISSLIVGLALIAVAGITGCSAMDMAGAACSSDGCPAGEVCDPGTQQCLPQAKATPGLEVLPPSGNNQGWVAQEFAKPDVDPDGKIHLKLARAVSVEGGVYASNDLTTVIPAQVVAWRDSLLEGRPKVQIEATTVAGKRDGNKQTYVLWLNPGHAYSFLVTPLPPFDALYPPLAVPAKTISDHLKKDFVLDGDDRAVKVTARVLQYGGAKPLEVETTEPPKYVDEKGNPFDASVRVRAYQSGGLRRSTTAETDPITGEFSFKVPAGVETYNVKVESATGGVPIPTLECRKVVLGLAQPTQSGPPVQTINDIQLPSFNIPQLYTVTVHGDDGTAEGAPIKGAAVTFSTEVKVVAQNAGFEGCTASYSRSGLTNAEGKVTLLLLPGTATVREYAVTVVSPAESPYASQWTTFEIGPPGFTKDIRLDERYELSGQVVGEDTGEPLAGVSLEAHGVSPGTAAVKVPATSATATTDKDGKYQLFVDPGIYNIDLRPPQNLGLPNIGMTAKVEGNVLGKQFVIPRPSVLLGQVRDPNGNPLSTAKVQMYELVPETEKPLTQKAAVRASSVTDADGLFGLLLAK